MPFLVAAVVLVGVLCALDLVLTLAVIRRLRQHTAKLAHLSAAGGGGLLPDGASLPVFEARSIDGEEVSERGWRLVAMLATTCQACAGQLPDLESLVKESGYAPDQVLAVVVGPDTPEGGELVDTVRPVATVVREVRNGALSRAFRAEIFPAFYQVEDGVVQAGAVSVAGLGEDVPA
ncbi:hypothetical protein [Nonomuraea sp. NPDC049480]|uniref:hypothetical protein n=1 Tax=Nonomuraea sp. NPDC049480 TaxID=3364353 RepID=UPI00379B808B